MFITTLFQKERVANSEIIDIIRMPWYSPVGVPSKTSPKILLPIILAL